MNLHFIFRFIVCMYHPFYYSFSNNIDNERMNELTFYFSFYIESMYHPFYFLFSNNIDKNE